MSIMLNSVRRMKIYTVLDRMVHQIKFQINTNKSFDQESASGYNSLSKRKYYIYERTPKK